MLIPLNHVDSSLDHLNLKLNPWFNTTNQETLQHGITTLKWQTIQGSCFKKLIGHLGFFSIPRLKAMP
jgi:hypothetical protein